MKRFIEVLALLIVFSSGINAQSNCEIDTIPPVIECLPTITLFSTSGEKIEIWAIELLLEVSDNCLNDRSDFDYSFASDYSLISLSDGPYIDNCDDVVDDRIIDEPLLTQDSIAIYVSDKSGNTSTCKTEIADISIEPRFNDCIFNYDFEFKLLDVNRNVTFERAPRLRILLPELFYDKDSIFYIEPTQIGQGYLYVPTNYTGRIIEKPHEYVSVILDFERLTSKFITVSDLIIIQNHILGLVPFTEDWQFTASDVNSDGSVSIQDLLLLRNIILGYENIIEIPSHTIIPDKENSLINDEFLDTANQKKDLEYTLVRIGDVNDQSN